MSEPTTRSNEGMAEREALLRANRRLAAAEQRIRTLEQECAEWRARHDAVVAQRDQARSALRDTRRVYRRVYRLVHRLVHLLVLAVREPRVGWRRIGAAIRRRLPLPARARGRTAPGARSSAGAPAQVRAPREVNRATCLYIAIGVSLDDLRVLARRAAEAALIAGDHVPVVVTDCVQFSLLRDAGVVFEYIPSRSAWSTSWSEQPWETMRSRRLSHLSWLHAPKRTIVVSGTGVPSLGDLLAVHLSAADGGRAGSSCSSSS